MPTRLGEFELVVLLALAQLGDDAYGVAVQQEIARRTGRRTSFGAIYATLSRLEEKGLVSTRLGEPTPQRGGRAKKHYRLRAAGRDAIRATLGDLRTMLRGLDPSLELP